MLRSATPYRSAHFRLRALPINSQKKGINMLDIYDIVKVNTTKDILDPIITYRNGEEGLVVGKTLSDKIDDYIYSVSFSDGQIRQIPGKCLTLISSYLDREWCFIKAEYKEHKAIIDKDIENSYSIDEYCEICPMIAEGLINLHNRREEFLTEKDYEAVKMIQKELDFYLHHAKMSGHMEIINDYKRQVNKV